MPDPVYLLDTNICIHIRRERPQEVLKRFESLTPGSTAISVVTYGELSYSACKSGNAEQASTILEQLVTLIPVLPLDAATARTYGKIRFDLSRRGEIIGNNDLWIAAHALSLGITLVTNNEREFQRIPNLKIENWVSAA